MFLELFQAEGGQPGVRVRGWNRLAASLQPIRAGAAGPTASPTDPARLSGNLRCQVGGLVHVGAVLQALAAIGQFPE